MLLKSCEVGLHGESGNNLVKLGLPAESRRVGYSLYTGVGNGG